MMMSKVCDPNRKNQYTVLYGPATLIEDFRNGKSFSAYAMKLNGYDFQFVTTKQPLYICGQRAIQTEHPKLSIVDKSSGNLCSKTSPFMKKK